MISKLQCWIFTVLTCKNTIVEEIQREKKQSGDVFYFRGYFILKQKEVVHKAFLASRLVSFTSRMDIS